MPEEFYECLNGPNSQCLPSKYIDMLLDGIAELDERNRALNQRNRALEEDNRALKLALIVSGSIIAAILLGTVVVYLLRKHRRAARDDPTDSTPPELLDDV